uniref:NAC domain-containing protein n=1 Tax=Loa loa TaxID=7209 RepID=A0A1I7W4S2_LOALO
MEGIYGGQDERRRLHFNICSGVEQPANHQFFVVVKREMGGKRDKQGYKIVAEKRWRYEGKKDRVTNAGNPDE